MVYIYLSYPLTVLHMYESYTTFVMLIKLYHGVMVLLTNMFGVIYNISFLILVTPIQNTM
jgi:hypothetical protein